MSTKAFAISRFSVAASAALLLALGVNAGFCRDILPIANPPGFATQLAQLLEWFIWGGCAALILGGIGVQARWTLPLGALSFAAVFWVHSFGWPIWNYTSHLLFALVILSVYEWSGRQEDRQKILIYLKVLFAAVYVQAGLSKLIYGGLTWFTSGKTIYVYAQIIGTPLGQGLGENAFLFPAATFLSFIVELILPLLLFIPRFELFALAGLLAFHAGVWMILGISFWHLWIPLGSITVLLWLTRRKGVLQTWNT